jgi:hypothetical protein
MERIHVNIFCCYCATCICEKKFDFFEEKFCRCLIPHRVGAELPSLEKLGFPLFGNQFTQSLWFQMKDAKYGVFECEFFV